MMKIKYLRGIFSLIISAGFFAGIAAALPRILSNRYLEYKMFRIIALDLQKSLNKWMLISLCACCALFMLLVLMQLAVKGLTLLIDFHIENEKQFNIIIVIIVCAIVLLCGGWGLNHYYLPLKFHPRSLLTNAGILGFTIVLGWSLLKLKRAYFGKLLKAKSILVTVLTVLLCFVLLNAGIVFDSTLNAPKGPNVILIIIDALRVDHLGCYGYKRDTSPTIDTLSSDGTLFLNAYSNAPWTKPSITSLFTSLLPNVHNNINLDDNLQSNVLTIAKILKNEGYSTWCFNGGNLNYNSLLQGFNEYWFETSAFIDEYTEQYIFDKGMTERVINNIEKYPQKRFFALIHYMSTHAPYNKNEYNNVFADNNDINTFFSSGTSLIGPNLFGKMFANNMLTNNALACLEAIYDGQILFVDQNINRIVEALKKNNLFRDSVIIVTADHGEEFADHKNFGHGHSLYNELLHVPLIIAGREIPHSKINDTVSLVDVFPTIVKITGIVKPEHLFLHGTELFHNSLDDSDRKRQIFAMGTQRGDEKYCLISGNKKLIINTFVKKKYMPSLDGFTSKDKTELYDLSSDPKEKINISTKEPKTVSLMQKELLKFVNSSNAFEKATSVIDDETRKHLKELGYLQ